MVCSKTEEIFVSNKSASVDTRLPNAPSNQIAEKNGRKRKWEEVRSNLPFSSGSRKASPIKTPIVAMAPTR